jgi:hypothetical protein
MTITSATASPPAAVAPPASGAPAAPQQSDEQRRKHHWAIPEVGQYGISAVFGHYFEALVSPKIRNGVEKMLGHDVDEPYTPKNTPGFLGREIAYGIGLTYLDNAVMGMMLKRAGQASGDMLTSSAGALGASAAAGAGMEASAAFRAMMGRNVVMVGAGVLFDAIWGAKIGNMIEGGINKMLGHQDSAPTDNKISSNVPLSTVKQTPEQMARAFGRSLAATMSYTILWQSIGTPIARAIFTGVGGPAGAVLGTLVGTLASSLGNHVFVNWGIGTPAADAAQAVMRLGERIVGHKLDEHTKPDVVPKVGDRFALAAELTAVPFLTALVSGRMGNYSESVKP